jgi:hypothetical protein
MIRPGWLALVVPLVLAGSPAATQTRGDTVLAAGPQYGAGALRRFLFGADYRDLWTLPVRVPFVDLASFGGGLTPTTAGGGRQTKSLRFRGEDGREYGFRSIDKDPANVLPPELRGTLAEDVVRDQTSSGFPYGPTVAARLMAAAGILHTEPMLVVLPDDPALGEHRQRFAGTVGFIAPRTIAGVGGSLAGADEIVDGQTMIDRRLAGPADGVDAPALLLCRLFDLLIGDWDRHRDQWRWARFGSTRPARWKPIPEDRDQAFVRFDGLLLMIARNTAPELVNFGSGHAATVGATWVGRDIDRLFLTALERSAWDSVAALLRTRLTDAAIDGAIAALPAEVRERRGAWLAATLRSRRDRLAAAATAYYDLLAREVDLEATAQADTATIERLPDGAVAVRLQSAGVEYLSRRFHPGETREIRLHLEAGKDEAIVRGSGPDRITVRVIGGGGDRLTDSSTAGGIRFYASTGDSAGGPGHAQTDRKPWTSTGGFSPGTLPRRDWGSRWQAVAVIGAAPDLGFVLGGGFLRTGYGFRKVPDASRLRIRAGYATGAQTGRTDVQAVFRRQNSRVRFDVLTLVSGLEVIRYHGLGNEVAAPQGDAYYRVNQSTFALVPEVVVPVGRADVALGMAVRYADTRETPGRIITDAPPYGNGNFGQAGLRGELRFDGRDVPGRPTRGAQLTAGGAWYPAVWDVDSAFGELHGELAGYVTAASVPLRPTLALRAGGRHVWGHYPFHEASFLGDGRTVRLGRQNRYGGDAAVWGNAELRMRLGSLFVLVPGEIGIFGLGDVGRVFLEGESSTVWHGAAGGGFWVSLLRPDNVLTIAAVRSAERTGVYFRAGFAY